MSHISHQSRYTDQYNPDGLMYCGHTMPYYNDTDAYSLGDMIDIDDMDDTLIDGGVTPSHYTDVECLKSTLHDAILKLTPNERTVLTMRFGIGCDPCTLRTVGEKLGRTKARIRQIEQDALRKLRHPARFEVLRWFTNSPPISTRFEILFNRIQYLRYDGDQDKLLKTIRTYLHYNALSKSMAGELIARINLRS